MGNATVKENDQSTTFECRLSSVVPDVEWRFSPSPDIPEQEIKIGEKYQISAEGTKHSLRLLNIRSSDQGQYSCVVNYEGADEIRTTANLTVTGKKYHYSTSCALNLIVFLSVEMLSFALENHFIFEEKNK